MHLLTIIGCCEKVAGRAEVAVEGFEDGKETLGVTVRCKALQRQGGLPVTQRPLSSPSLLVRVLGAIIQVTTPTALGVGQQLFESSSVAA